MLPLLSPGLFPLFMASATALLIATEDSARFVLANDRLHVALNKTTGGLYEIVLDGQDLLGDVNLAVGDPKTQNGVLHGEGGLFLDCYCVPPYAGNTGGTYTPGGIDPQYRLVQGKDGDGIAYAGLILSEVYPPTGQRFEQSWFLRDGNETALHAFTRLVYHNATTPFLRNLQEFRTLLKHNSTLWTTLSTNAAHWAPAPGRAARAAEVTVQDATWWLGGTPDDAFVQQASDFFTKYTFADTWRDHRVHGLYADGHTSPDNTTFGAWLVQTTQDTYYGGPLHSDLTVDGIVYNYLVSNHHGAGTPNITDGFDRTFGPHVFYFNHGPAGASLDDLREDALHLNTPHAFYDAIAPHVPGYVPLAGRGFVAVRIRLPPGAQRPLAILSVNGTDPQDSANDPNSFQYWADLDVDGTAVLPRVVAGTYRLTVWADGIFGQHAVDDIQVQAGQTATVSTAWIPESAGTELWRLGSPDRSAGEFRHGTARDPAHPRHFEEYRVYWGAYDFAADFPDGVVFTIGASDAATDWNYVHWSVFGGPSDYYHRDPVYDVNNWTILFDVDADTLDAANTATLTVQLAAAKTAAGNTDIADPDEPYADLPLAVVVNGYDLPPWIVPHDHSASAGARSAVTGYTLAHRFVFPAGLLVAGRNAVVLHLPFNATDTETALLPASVYVQYDALRLEVHGGVTSGWGGGGQ